ncbi:MAG TPA: class I SAM-dependent methyltransferase [Candidatus Latescibacteria bacterium]|nr:class I SAM-dependent methyltransferase [Candidatus Latescibacterota bacterium]
MREIGYLRLSVPEEYASVHVQPHLYRDWFCGNAARRYIQYCRRPLEVISQLPIKPGDRVLDVGCGWGYASMLVNSRGAQAFGIDIEEEAIAFGRALARANGFIVDLRCGDARRLDYPDGYFDHIISIETFEHIPAEERQLVLLEMKRCVRDNGRIVISTPNRLGTAELAKSILGRSRRIRQLMEPGTDWGDKHPMVSSKEMIDLIRSVGLTLEKLKHIIFMVKFMPDSLFSLALNVERTLEALPFVSRFGATSIYVIRKKML